MSDIYINLLDAIKELDKCDDRRFTVNKAKKSILHVPFADVAPRDSAHWIDPPEKYDEDGQRYYMCSKCYCEVPTVTKYDFCPHCGRKMSK